MATRTVTLYGSASAYVDKSRPSLVNNTEKTAILEAVPSETEGYFWYSKFCFEKFSIPEEIKGKRFVKATLHFYGGESYAARAYSAIYPIISTWEPSKTSYNNQPRRTEEYIHFYFGGALSWRSVEITDTIEGADIATFGFMIAYRVTHNFPTFYTSNSDHKPYLELTYEDDDSGVYVSELDPDGSFLNDKNARVSFCTQNMPSTIGIAQITKATVNWSYDGQNFAQNYQITDQREDRRWWYYFTIPADKLPKAGSGSWSVTITDSLGNVRTSETATFYTTDATMYATARSPVNAYVDGSKDVYLRWGRSISTGTPPEGADFQASDDNGTTWDDLGHTDGYADFLASPGKLPSGNVLWRVRGYNSDGVAGPWSSPAAIVVRQAPKKPEIHEITNVPKPIVSWRAEGQQGYQLQIGTWDSGTVFGTEKTDQCPEFLLDGVTTVRLRVQNSFGMWSAWAETTVNIQNRPGAAITARTRAHRAAVHLSWETAGNYPEYLIYRDGEVIGITAGKEYTDHTAIGKAVYTVRGVNYDSTYTDSPPVTEILTIKSGLIARQGVWDWMLLDRRVGARPARSGGEEADVSYNSYSGRPLPVAELSGHRQRSHSYTYSLPSMEEVRRLAEMSGHLVLYKHRSGERAAGILGGVSWAWNRLRWDVSFTITEVDGNGPVL